MTAPDFSLKGVDGKMYSIADVRGPKGLLVMFICNHCPYVQAILDPLLEDVKKLQSEGIGCIAIMSNDTLAYPEDGFAAMKHLSQEKQFSFPYVIDETQEIARLYDAVCTPDFFGFNHTLTLCYRGRFDASGKKRDTQTAHELLEAMQLVAKSGKGPAIQYPSIGCSIKWRNN